VHPKACPRYGFGLGCVKSARVWPGSAHGGRGSAQNLAGVRIAPAPCATAAAASGASTAGRPGTGLGRGRAPCGMPFAQIKAPARSRAPRARATVEPGGHRPCTPAPRASPRSS